MKSVELIGSGATAVVMAAILGLLTSGVSNVRTLNGGLSDGGALNWSDPHRLDTKHV